MATLSIELEDPRVRLLVCGYTRIFPNQWNFPGVSVPYWRYYWNSAPGASVRCGADSVDLTPDVALLIRPNTLFSTANKATCDHLYVHFQMPAHDDLAAGPLVTLAMTEPMESTSETLIGMLDGAQPSPRQVSLVGRALVEVAISTAVTGESQRGRMDVRVLRVLAYMDEHLKPTTTNADLAAEARMSASALNHLFKDQVGHSLQAYLRIKRIEKAALLLQFSDLSIEQVAEETGFCDRYHFSRVFRALQGASPASFRQAHANPFVRNG